MANVLQLKKSEWAPFEDAMRSWRGPHPYVKGEVIGFWTLRGWFDISEARASENYSLLQKRSYAIHKMQDWYPRFLSGEITREKIEEQESEDFYELQILIYDEDRIRAPKNQAELYEADVIQISEGVRRAFKTPGFEKAENWKKGLLDIGKVKAKGFATKAYLTLKAFGNVLFSIPSSIKEAHSPASFLKIVSDKAGQSLEVMQVLFSYFTEVLVKVLIPFGLFYGLSLIIPTLKGMTLNSFLAKVFLPKSLEGGWTSIALSSYLSMAIVTAIKEAFDRTAPDTYALYTRDILASITTPQKIEAEYNEKVDEIMADESLTWKEMRDKILEIHKEFQKEVRPAIEKGIYLGKLGEDQDFLEMVTPDALYPYVNKARDKWNNRGKKASEVKMPASLRVLEARLTADFKVKFDEMIKSGEVSALIYDCLSGKKAIPEDIRERVGSDTKLIKQVQAKLEEEIDFSQLETVR